MTIGVYPLRPESTGSVHIKSSSPLDYPLIQTRFLDHEDDRKRLVSGNTNAATLMIAEKGADMVLEDKIAQHDVWKLP